MYELLKVACSAEGAAHLLESGVVERLAESDGMARASQIAAQASKLGALSGEAVGMNGGNVSYHSYARVIFFFFPP